MGSNNMRASSLLDKLENNELVGNSAELTALIETIKDELLK